MKNHLYFKHSMLTIFAMIFLSGCSSLGRQVPDSIALAPPGDLQLAEALQNINQHKNTPIRWGGTIISVEEKGNMTHIQVMHSQLGERGKPLIQSKSSHGRFIIAVPKPDGSSEEPVKNIYLSLGGRLTVSGNILDESEVLIGKTSTKIPVVSALELHTWNNTSTYDSYYDPYYRSPFHGGFHYRHHYYWPHFYHHRHYYPRYRRCY